MRVLLVAHRDGPGRAPGERANAAGKLQHREVGARVGEAAPLPTQALLSGQHETACVARTWAAAVCSDAWCAAAVVPTQLLHAQVPYGERVTGDEHIPAYLAQVDSTARACLSAAAAHNGALPPSLQQVSFPPGSVLDGVGLPPWLDVHRVCSSRDAVRLGLQASGHITGHNEKEDCNTSVTCLHKDNSLSTWEMPGE